MQPQPTRTELLAQRNELKRQLRALREQREADELVAARLPRVQAEIAAERRDRDAEMSAELERHRADIERGMLDVEELVVAMSRLWTVVQVAELGPEDPRMRAAVRAVEEHMALALSTFAAAVNDEDSR